MIKEYYRGLFRTINQDQNMKPLQVFVSQENASEITDIGDGRTEELNRRKVRQELAKVGIHYHLWAKEKNGGALTRPVQEACRIHSHCQGSLQDVGWGWGGRHPGFSFPPAFSSPTWFTQT